MTGLRLFAIRYGETVASRDRRFAGARDADLTPHGRRQCEEVAEALAGAPLAAVYASPREPARLAAALIAEPHRLPVRVEPAFREMAFGEWEGCTLMELETRSPREAATWATTPHLVTPAGGEPLAEVAARVVQAVARLIAAHPGQAVVVVTHAIVIRLVVLAALGLGPERLWAVDASPASITEVEYQGGWATVHRMNTVAHLDALRETVP